MTQQVAEKPVIPFDDFIKLDLRVATIKSCEPHPNADRLLKIQLDDGTPDGRQVCAGIKEYCSDLEVLVGRQIVVVANLAPRTIRGEESNGMLLAASSLVDDQLTDIVLLTPDKAVPNGAPVS